METGTGQLPAQQTAKGKVLTSLPSIKLFPNMRQEICRLAGGRVGVGDEMAFEIRKPLVLEHLLSCRALLGIDGETRADEIACSLRDVFPVLGRLKLVVAVHNRARFLLGCVTVERRVSTQEEVSDHAHGPDVDRFPVPSCRRSSGTVRGPKRAMIRTPFEDLRGHVPGRTTDFSEQGQFVLVHNAA